MSSPLRILCLENDLADAELLQDTLETEGIACKLTRVEAECDFRAALQQGGFDLILADYTLPSFDGLSALRIVRQQLPDVPFIFVSGTLGEEVAIEALKMGATDYVFKTRLYRLVPAIHRAMREAGERTELRRSEEMLREQANLLDLTHDAIFVMDMEGVIQYWNHGAEELYGWTAEEALGKVVHHLLRTAFPRTLEELKADVLRKGRWGGELVHTKKDGSQLVVATRWSLQRNEQGTAIAILEINNDITERKQAEEALRRSEAYLAESQRLTHTGSWAWDAATGKYVYWSEELFGIFGFDPQETFGTLEEIVRRFHPEDRDRFKASFERSLREKIDTFCECRYVMPDGTLKHLHLLRHPVLNEAGEIIQLMGTTVDITERKRIETALRRSEAYLAEAQRLSHTGSWVRDNTGELIYWSDELFRIFGIDPQQGMPSREALARRVHPDDLGLVKASIEKAFREKVDVSDEYRIVLPDGTVKHVHVIRHPVLNDAGELVEFLGTLIDITERKRAEDELRDSETRFRTFWDHAADAFFVHDQRHKVLDVNRQACESLGYTREELIGMVPQDFDPDVDAALLQWIRERIDAGEVCTFETRHRRKDGTAFPVEVRVRPLWHQGRSIHLSVARDITERKRAEETLRESETRFRTFVDHAGDALFVYDLEQKTVVDVNREACESLGYTRQELIGNTPFAYHLDPYQAEMDSVAERAAAGETVFDTHYHRRKDGTVFPVEVHTSLVSYAGRRFLLMVARNISDRVRAEEQRGRLLQLEADLAHMNRVSTIGELGTSLAHELNQPITGAITSADACLRWLAREPPELERARAATMRVKKDGTRAAEIINRLRAFYKKGAPPNREPVNVHEVVNEMGVLLRNEANRHSVTIRTEMPREIPEILADRVQLQQVFMNLMLNAIEAMQDIGGELTIRSQRTDNGMLLMSVSDTGVGLPTEGADQIFAAFFTSKPQGTGMGLTITRSIVEAHGGRLWASANAERGATFHFTLPADAGAMNEQS